MSWSLARLSSCSSHGEFEGNGIHGVALSPQIELVFRRVGPCMYNGVLSVFLKALLNPSGLAGANSVLPVTCIFGAYCTILTSSDFYSDCTNPLATITVYSSGKNYAAVIERLEPYLESSRPCPRHSWPLTLSYWNWQQSLRLTSEPVKLV